jgi:glutaredoxin
MKELKLTLFVSKSSLYFQKTIDAFQEAVAQLEKERTVQYELVDVNEHPERLKQVAALPTVWANEIAYTGPLQTVSFMNFIHKYLP